MTDPAASYFDTSTWDPRDRISGGARMVPIETAHGTFRVWTKRVGTNPDLKVLLLHGGPGCSGEFFECFDAWFPAAGIEYYSVRAHQPGDLRADAGAERAGPERDPRGLGPLG